MRRLKRGSYHHHHHCNKSNKRSGLIITTTNSNVVAVIGRGVFILLLTFLSIGSTLVLSVAAAADKDNVVDASTGGHHHNETNSTCPNHHHLGVQSMDATRFQSTGMLHLRALIIVNMPPFVVLDNDDDITKNNKTTTTTTTTLNNNETTATLTEEEDFNTQQLKYYNGLMPDILREIQRIAFQEDGINFTVSLEPIENSFLEDVFQSSLNELAIDCNTTTNPRPWEDCIRYDIAIGPYWPNLGQRSLKGLFTPPLMETGSATARYIETETMTSMRKMTIMSSMMSGGGGQQASNIQSKSNPVKSLQVAEILGSPICIDGGDFSANYEDDILAVFPNLNITHYCDTQQECLQYLQQDPQEGGCVLFIGDELVLRYKSTMLDEDAHMAVGHELFVSSEHIFRQYIAWAINSRLDTTIQFFLRKWIYRLKEIGYLDRLFNDYFSVFYCPLGKAGTNCDEPCHPVHGLANREGVCICDSTKWTGNDCSIEVLEDFMLIPTPIKYASFCLMGINFVAVVYCGGWLLWNWLFRNHPKVIAAQPFFLLLVLLGCLISTSTIIAMAQETSSYDEPIPACMAVPWLYSVGFCITFGSLFAKIRRIYILFQAAIRFQKIQVTTRDTLLIVGGILAMDMSILVSWTVLEPLQWERVVLSMDKYGTPLNSVGYCVSDHWMVFLGLIALFHFLLMSVASYMCYKARNLPTLFYEGKYIAFAMISNLQIFVVAVPVMLILGVGEQGGTSFALRSVVIWMNDFVVLFLIFGNLMGFFNEDSNSSDEEQTNFRSSGAGPHTMAYVGGGAGGGVGVGGEPTEPSTEDRFASKPEEAQEMATPMRNP